MDKVKLGFIGSGGIVKAHLNNGLKDFPDVEFAGWCDIKEETAAARREEVGGKGKIFTDVREMLDKAKPDAVYIMLPPFAHGEPEDLVIERKLPFFIEKPVAIDMPTALRVAGGVAKNNLITSVGYMNRYRNSVLRVRSLLETQPPVMLHGGWVGGGPSDYTGIWSWWIQKHMSGGQFLEQTTHTIDLARFLFGDATHVYAVPVKNRRERPSHYTIEDASMVQLKFANGAAGSLYSSCCTSLGNGVTLTVFGTDFRAEFTGWEHKVSIWLAGGEQVIVPGEDKIFSLEDRAFIDSVKAGANKGILATYDDGLKATAIACAADSSMETGNVVELDI